RLPPAVDDLAGHHLGHFVEGDVIPPKERDAACHMSGAGSNIAPGVGSTRGGIIGPAVSNGRAATTTSPRPSQTATPAAPSTIAGLTRDALVGIYRTMLLSRRIDDKELQLK